MANNYDEKLLAAAPAATRAELQEGYNVDILTPTRAVHAPEPPETVPKAANGGGSRQVSREKLAHYPPASPPVSPRLPWWRTGKGAIIIAVVILVVIGVVVGVAVGVTHNSNSNGGQSSSASGIATSTSTSLQQGAPNPMTATTTTSSDRQAVSNL